MENAGFDFAEFRRIRELSANDFNCLYVSWFSWMELDMDIFGLQEIYYSVVEIIAGI